MKSITENDLSLNDVFGLFSMWHYVSTARVLLLMAALMNAPSIKVNECEINSRMKQATVALVARHSQHIEVEDGAELMLGRMRVDRRLESTPTTTCGMCGR